MGVFLSYVLVINLSFYMLLAFLRNIAFVSLYTLYLCLYYYIIVSLMRNTGSSCTFMGKDSTGRNN